MSTSGHCCRLPFTRETRQAASARGRDASRRAQVSGRVSACVRSGKGRRCGWGWSTSTRCTGVRVSRQGQGHGAEQLQEGEGHGAAGAWRCSCPAPCPCPALHPRRLGARRWATATSLQHRCNIAATSLQHRCNSACTTARPRARTRRKDLARGKRQACARPSLSSDCSWTLPARLSAGSRGGFNDRRALYISLSLAATFFSASDTRAHAQTHTHSLSHSLTHKRTQTHTRTSLFFAQVSNEAFLHDEIHVYPGVKLVEELRAVFACNLHRARV